MKKITAQRNMTTSKRRRIAGRGLKCVVEAAMHMPVQMLQRDSMMSLVSAWHRTCSDPIVVQDHLNHQFGEDDMKTSIKRFAPAAAVALLLGACASTPSSKSTGEYIDDAAISAKVKSALIASSDTKARDIDVNVYKGVVQLSGFVDSANESAEAQRIASNVAGVEKVENRLSIR